MAGSSTYCSAIILQLLPRLHDSVWVVATQLNHNWPIERMRGRGGEVPDMVFQIVLVIQQLFRHEHLGVCHCCTMLSCQETKREIGLIDHGCRNKR